MPETEGDEYLSSLKMNDNVNNLLLKKQGTMESTKFVYCSLNAGERIVSTNVQSSSVNCPVKINFIVCNLDLLLSH